MNEEIVIATNTTDIAPILGATTDDRLIDLWLHGRSRATQKGYRAGAKRFQMYVNKPLNAITLADLQNWSDTLEANGLQPATRRRLLASVKALFAFAHRLGYLPYDTARPLRLPALRDSLAERIFDETLILRMISLEPNPRNAAILSLLYAAGLRISELVSLKWKNMQPRDQGQAQVTVLGKGGRTRSILIKASVYDRLLAIRQAASDEDPVFRSRKKGHLDPGHVLKITKRAARRAGISRSIRNHDLRHCHASHSLERGAPISLVSQTLGHASIATTGRYLHARPGDSSGRYLPI